MSKEEFLQPYPLEKDFPMLKEYYEIRESYCAQARRDPTFWTDEIEKELDEIMCSFVFVDSDDTPVCKDYCKHRE